MLAACSGGGGNNTPNPTPTVPAVGPTAGATTRPTTAPSTSPSTSPSAVASAVATTAANAAAFVCPTSDTVSQSSARSARGDAARIGVRKFKATASAPTMLEVTYATSAATRTALSARESSLGVKAVHELSFPNSNRTTRLVAVTAANADATAASLRTQAGVVSVTAQTSRRHPLSVTTPYYTNDPYFNGFTTTIAPETGATTPPATYHVGPYEESDSVPGQWNMHAIGLEKAFAYSQSGNGSGVVNANALGNPSVKLAIIDTGADTTIPELSGKVVTQGCFITNPSGVQSTGNFVTDEDGHGTDTSGLAAANTNNSLGFAGAGGNVSLMEYRVDPTPDDNCLDESSSGDDPQCSANVSDLADAVVAATNAGANVISLSLGGGGCNSDGSDQDAEEGQALSYAFSKNVVVVASSGNDAADTQGSIAAPACVNGVIAAGASALSDGTQPTGSGNTTGTVSAPVEYVASYSQYGTPSSALHSASAWGIVAPGGDPGDAETGTNGVIDDLHWIIDTYTHTPLDEQYAGGCNPDYPNGGSTTGTIDCRILIAGTSMSAPTVAGAAALIISASSTYQSPSAMKTLLCTTTDDIGDSKEGCGRLNVYRAMAKAVGDPTLP